MAKSKNQLHPTENLSQERLEQLTKDVLRAMYDLQTAFKKFADIYTPPWKRSTGKMNYKTTDKKLLEKQIEESLYNTIYRSASILCPNCNKRNINIPNKYIIMDRKCANCHEIFHYDPKNYGY